jgi:hypothetical protein
MAIVRLTMLIFVASFVLLTLLPMFDSNSSGGAEARPQWVDGTASGSILGNLWWGKNSLCLLFIHFKKVVFAF